jgi:hypothetical protein
MSNRALALDHVIGTLEGLNVSDFEFVLAGVAARFPHGNPVTIGGRARSAYDGGGRQTFFAEGATFAAPVWENRVTTHVNGRSNERGRRHPAGDEDDLSRSDGIASIVQEDFRVEVRMIIASMGFLAAVARDPAADVPSMARKAVQKRLNKKRKDLQTEFLKLSIGPSDGWLGFCTLNSVQKFRLALSDSLETEGVILATNPMPANVAVYFDFLEEIAGERASKAMVSNQGFYTNDDGQYVSPEGAHVGPIMDEAW